VHLRKCRLSASSCRSKRYRDASTRDRLQFQRGLLHDSKGIAAAQARLIWHHQCVRWRARKGWPTTSTVSTCKAAVVHLARSPRAPNSWTAGSSRDTLSPGPNDTGDVPVRFAGEEQGDAVKGVLATNIPAIAWLIRRKSRSWRCTSRPTMSGVRRRSRLPDRRGVSAISPVGA